MTTTLPPSGDTPAELAEHLASGARLVEAFHLMPGVARAMREAARLLRKPCTCHPDDNPPFPCPRKYALSECRAAAPPAVQAEPAAFPGGPRMGSALQKLGARLADMLDDDQWNNIEPMLLDVHAEAAPPAVQAEPVASDNYVQPVPDHCDRITWRGQYLHLPLAAPPAAPTFKLAGKADFHMSAEFDLPIGTDLYYAAPPAVQGETNNAKED